MAVFFVSLQECHRQTLNFHTQQKTSTTTATTARHTIISRRRRRNGGTRILWRGDEVLFFVV